MQTKRRAQTKPAAKKEAQGLSQGTLIAIYNSIDLISSCFPAAAYRLYRENLITRNDFIGEVLLRLHEEIEQCGNYELFLSINDDLLLTDADADLIYSWIAKTTIYQKNATWYKGGVRSEADIVAMIEAVHVRSLEVYRNMLESDEKAAATMVGIGIRNLIDVDGLRIRNEDNYRHQKECARLEQGGFLKKGQ